MTRSAIVHGFGPSSDQRPLLVEWANGRPVVVAPAPRAGSMASAGFDIFPGFTDLHIHGAFGIDFMSASPEQMIELAERLSDIGYDTFLPTTITAPFEDAMRAIENLPDHPAMPGFHLEGPFISPEYPGAQPKEFILDPPTGPSEWDAVFDHPKLKRITLAPERPGALDLIRRLSARGVQVSMGHTAATYAEARAGIEAGVSSATHTFNAMRGLHHREPGALGAILSDYTLVPELIYDRVHVSPAAAGVLLNANPSAVWRNRYNGPDPRSVIVVSDCTQAAGMPPGHEFEMWGIKVVTAEGEVRLRENGALAGSAATLRDGFERLTEDFWLDLAIHGCCLTPRMGLLENQAVRTWLEHDGRHKTLTVHRVGLG